MPHAMIYNARILALLAYSDHYPTEEQLLISTQNYDVK